MKRMARREVIGVFGIAAVAAAAGLVRASNAAAQAAGAPQAGFDPPLGAYTYTRRLEREMTGGARFVVMRRFAVRLARTADGFELAGEQSAVSVEAPPALARFAELERARVESGLFPLRLDSRGQIVGWTSAQASRELAAAVEQAHAMAAGAAIPADEQARLRGFIEAVHRAASSVFTNLPADLFAPATPLREDRQGLDLPEGLRGEVVARFSAETDGATGLMRSARRSVVTQVAGNRRETLESWSLARTE